MKIKSYIKAIASYVPTETRKNDLSSRLTRKTGIEVRHIARKDECSSDLAVMAAKKLFDSFAIDKKKIDFLLFCTQSPDYFLPSTSCVIQNRLELSRSCGAFDYNLGCSGYVYGLSIAKGLVESGQANMVLLLTAETYSKYINRGDRTTESLFGDGAAASLICGERSEEEGIWATHFGTDGTGAEYLIVPAGASRHRAESTDRVETMDEKGCVRSNYDLYMNGSEITKFALNVVPNTLDQILQKSGLTKKDIDYYVFHQANRFMLNFLKEKCELEGMAFWNDPREYGNTVSASIPLALEAMLKTVQPAKMKKVLLIGFGVGLSWGGCIVDLSRYLLSDYTQERNETI